MQENFFAECCTGKHSANFFFVFYILCRVPGRGHSAKGFFFFFKKSFAECWILSTRQRLYSYFLKFLCRVPDRGTRQRGMSWHLSARAHHEILSLLTLLHTRPCRRLHTHPPSPSSPPTAAAPRARAVAVPLAYPGRAFPCRRPARRPGPSPPAAGPPPAAVPRAGASAVALAAPCPMPLPSEAPRRPTAASAPPLRPPPHGKVIN